MTKSDILNYLKEHYQEFKSQYNVEKIGLFGSYARDEATKDSDIDIFVTMKPNMFDMIAIKEQIEEDLHTKVDIIREHKNMKPFFLEMISKDLVYA
ncbi:MAG: nucleotidyltransferase domain-containing protein [Sulfurimonas sp.]|uniref:nucleotidyltransferase family protein n=1 Tax=Sulfurimonas sp. TaxID=2022749 RepID=UPI0026078D39|nr:nucleotidyltransferase domain-containing protein [Sulfurimonas sp.]MDD5371944.1 nucleotidyltransferase domain-containing protein [Sulfurimonas sp.]